MAPDGPQLGLYNTITGKLLIYNTLETSISRVTIKMRKPHHASHALERVAYIKISQNQTLKRLKNHPWNRDTMGDIPHLLSTLKIKETQKKHIFRKGVRSKIIIRAELCMTKILLIFLHIKPGQISSKNDAFRSKLMRSK